MTVPVRFSQADVKRAIRGIKAAGEKVSHVTVEPDGRIMIYVGDASNRPAGNEWDEVFEEAKDAS